MRKLAVLLLVVLWPGSALANDWKDCQSEDIDRSIAGCSRIINAGREKKRDLAIAYANRAQGYRGRKDYAAAALDLDKALETFDKNNWIWETRGWNRTDLKEYDGALEDFEQAIAINPKSDDAYRGKGYALDLKKDPDGAIEAYTKAIELAPKNAVGYASRAQVFHWGKADLERANADAEKAITLDNMTLWIIGARADVRAARGDYDGALADADAMIRVDPASADGYVQRGSVLKDKGDLSGSIAAYNKALDIDPNNAWALNGRAWTFYHLEEFRRTIEDATKAIEIDDGPATRDTRGWGYLGVREWQKAFEDFQKALEGDPRQMPSYAGRGLAYTAMGKTEEAIRDLDKATSLAPRNKDERDAIDVALLTLKKMRERPAPPAAPPAVPPAASPPTPPPASPPQTATPATPPAAPPAPTANPATPPPPASGEPSKQPNPDSAPSAAPTQTTTPAQPIAPAQPVAPAQPTKTIDPVFPEPTGPIDREADLKDCFNEVMPGKTIPACKRRIESNEFSGRDLADLQTSLARAWSKLGYFEHEAEMLAAARKSDPTVEEYASLHASVLRKLKDFGGAFAAAIEAVKLDPKSPRAYVERALCRSDQRDFTAALADLDTAAGLDSKSALVWVGRGRVLNDKGEADAALAALDKAVEADANYAEAWFFRALQNERMARIQPMLDDAKKAIPLIAGDAAKLAGLAFFIGKTGQLDDAIKTFDAALEVDKDFVVAAAGRAFTKMAVWEKSRLAADRDAAIADFEKMLAMTPRSLFENDFFAKFPRKDLEAMLATLRAG